MKNFIINIIKVIVGDVLVKIIGFASLIIITRFFSPEQMGVYEFIISIQFIIISFASLRYEPSILLPDNDSDANNIFIGVIFLNIFFATLSYLFLEYFISYHKSSLDLSSVEPYLVFIPLLVFSKGIREYSIFFFSRAKFFGRQSIMELIFKIMDSSLKIILGYLGIGVLGLLSGNLLAFVSLGVFVLIVIINNSMINFKEIKFKTIKKNFIKYKKYPLYSLPANCMKIVNDRFMLLFILPFYGLKVVGLYTVGYKLINEPMSILGNSISRVFYKEIVDLKGNSVEIENFTKKLLELLNYVSIVPFLFLAFFGENIFHILLPKNWNGVGEIMVILSAMLYLRFIYMSFVNIVGLFDKQKIETLTYFLQFIVLIVLFSLKSFIPEYTHLLKIFTFLISIIYLIFIIKLFTFLYISVTKFINIYIKILPRIIVILILFAIIRYYFDYGLIKLLLGSFVVVVYYVYSLFVEGKYKQLKDMLINEKR